MQYLLILLTALLQPALLTANTVVHAVRAGNLNAVKRAVGAAIDINATDPSGRNALHHAAILGKIDIVEYLLANAASPKQKDADHKVPFQLAIEHKMTIERAKVASVLLHAIQGLNGRDDKGWSALHWAILAKDRPLIDRWLDAGAPLLRWGQLVQRQHPIEIAFLTQDVELIDYLVDRYEKQKGTTALWDAVNSDVYALVEYLIARGHAPADTYERFSSRGLLQVASSNGNVKMLELLLENGAPIHDSFPLIEAARHKKHEIVKLLIEHGMAITASNYSDWQALMLATLRSGDKDLFAKTTSAAVQHSDEMLPAFVDFFGNRLSSSTADFIMILEALLEHGVDINAIDRKGKGISPLHNAIRSYRIAHSDRVRDATIVGILVSYGANIEQRNFDSMTPLMSAAEKGSDNVAQELIESGADLQATTDDGHNALYFAKRELRRAKVYEISQVPSYKRIIRMLER